MPTSSRRRPPPRRAASALFVMLIGGAELGAQAASIRAAVIPPPGWSVVADAGGDRTKVIAEEMKPGFHVTTGPAAILFDSAMRATGDWRLEATIHLFDPGARAEGFGVIFGGANLQTPAARYGYALLRRDGKAMLKARDGATTRTVRDWTANAAIPVYKAGPPGTSVRYQLVVEAKGDRVGLWVGPTQVIDAPRGELPTDGIVGIRINHALNVHVERVAVSTIPRR
ncbi:MAG: hypothetical protein U5K74_01890 [Gemmatimonadaceae bacterium]|nr:hypothetical protein [Gemmatimonadaceae bacterium]